MVVRLLGLALVAWAKSTRLFFSVPTFCVTLFCDKNLVPPKLFHDTWRRVQNISRVLNYRGL